MISRDKLNCDKHEEYEDCEDYYNTDDSQSVSGHKKESKWGNREKERTIKIREARRQKRQQHET
jgi:hypothetical protein